MRTLLLSLAFAPLLLAAQSPSTTEPKGAINWLTIEEAQAQAKKVPKPLMIDVYTTWCGPCKMLDARTFRGQKLENPEFNPGQVGGRNGTHQLTYMIANVQGRIAYPTVVYLDSDLNVLAPVQGYMTPDQMEPILHYFGGSHYKAKDYQTFMGDFKPKWTAQ